MPEHSQRWRIAPPIPAEARQALQDYSPILSQLLYNRQKRTSEQADEFVRALPPAGCDPMAMLGMPAAVARIRSAISRQESIAIYGDYDADGVTATALLSLAFAGLGADVRGYIPNRFDEGYGLNVEALEELHNQGVSLVITVDCGIRSLVEAAYAQSIGLDLIITDHHHPGAELPAALAVINPKQAGDIYPEKNLAGVGLAYKLAEALSEPGDPAVEQYLDLVALGTVADMAPLSGENRSLVRRGLNQLRLKPSQGLASLMGIAGVTPNTLNAGSLGFALGPRLNAAGRIDTANNALRLLTTSDLFEAGELAQVLDNQNRERQRLTREIQEHAEQIAFQEHPDAWLLFAASPDFNHGVVGLAASRLTERYYRPAIVAQIDQETTRGSCRSIPEFHITNALDECADLLVKHGGHAAAAGFTVRNEYRQELIERLLGIAERELSGLELRQNLRADLEIPLSEVKPAVLEDLKKLEPTGQESPRAIFVSRNLRVTRASRMGSDGSHLKLEVQGSGITYTAVAFQMGQRLDTLPKQIDLMYYYELNEYNGRQTLQLKVIDFKPAGASDD